MRRDLIEQYFSAGVVAMLAVLTGCGGGSGGDDPNTVPDPTPVVTNAAPVISGTPADTVVVGSSYVFAPTASDADGDELSFSVANLPAWASFDNATGTLNGTPASADIGTYTDIVLTVSDGTDATAMQSFAITVTDNASGSAMLHWTPPAQNSDGSELADLAGYKVYYGASPGSHANVIDVPSAGISSYMVEGLAPGTYYFAVSAYDGLGNESAVSNEVSKTVL